MSMGKKVVPYNSTYTKSIKFAATGVKQFLSQKSRSNNTKARG